MRFPSRTRESPHFPASTRPIVKHIFGTSRGDDGAELAAAEKGFAPGRELNRLARFHS
jgi:hypothetical protein